jgi:CRP-like cAMP-binding protein
MTLPFENGALQPKSASLDNVHRAPANARLRQFTRGETIYEPGMPEFVGYVVTGAVKLVTFLPDGRSNIIGVIEAPGFFGRLFGVTREFAMEAASDAVLACFDRSSFEAGLSGNPELEHSIHIANLHQLDEAHERIIVLACQSIIERISTFMVLKMLDAQLAHGQRMAIPTIHIPITDYSDNELRTMLANEDFASLSVKFGVGINRLASEARRLGVSLSRKQEVGASGTDTFH